MNASDNIRACAETGKGLAIPRNRLVSTLAYIGPDEGPGRINLSRRAGWEARQSRPETA